jgi:hypothetical protein
MDVVGVISVADGLVSAGLPVGVVVPVVDDVGVRRTFVPVALVDTVGVPVV